MTGIVLLEMSVTKRLRGIWKSLSCCLWQVRIHFFACCFLSKIIYCSLEINTCNCYMLFYSSSWAFLYSSRAYRQILFHAQTPVTSTGLVFVLCSSLELALGRESPGSFHRLWLLAVCSREHELWDLRPGAPLSGTAEQQWQWRSSSCPKLVLGMENSCVKFQGKIAHLCNVLLPSWREDAFIQQKILWNIVIN